MHQFTYKAKETEVHAITHTKATKKKEKEKTVKRELRKAKVLSCGYYEKVKDEEQKEKGEERKEAPLLAKEPNRNLHFLCTKRLDCKEVVAGFYHHFSILSSVRTK